MENLLAGWDSHGKGGAVLGFGEQARHEYMSDECKDRYIIITLLKTPPRYYSQYREYLESKYRTGRGVDLIKHN